MESCWACRAKAHWYTWGSEAGQGCQIQLKSYYSSYWWKPSWWFPDRQVRKHKASHFVEYVAAWPHTIRIPTLTSVQVKVPSVGMWVTNHSETVASFSRIMGHVLLQKCLKNGTSTMMILRCWFGLQIPQILSNQASVSCTGQKSPIHGVSSSHLTGLKLSTSDSLVPDTTAYF